MYMWRGRHLYEVFLCLNSSVGLCLCLSLPWSFPLSLSFSLHSSPPQCIFQTEFSYSSESLGSRWLGMGVLPQSLFARLWRQPLRFEHFPHHANWQRHAFQKPTANLLIIIYLQRPSGSKSCKNHTWYGIRSLASCLLLFSPLLACRIKYP